jgi:hypothetical protein
VKTAAIALSARNLACEATIGVISVLLTMKADHMLWHIVGWDTPSSISHRNDAPIAG